MIKLTYIQQMKLPNKLESSRLIKTIEKQKQKMRDQLIEIEITDLKQEIAELKRKLNAAFDNLQSQAKVINKNGKSKMSFQSVSFYSETF